MDVPTVAELFKAGPPLTEDEQIGRRSAIEALFNRAVAGEVLRLFDQRREGKTSLALAVLARARVAGVMTCHVPLDEYPTAPAAAARILAQMTRTRELVRQAERVGGKVTRLAGRIAGAIGEGDLAELAKVFADVDAHALRLPEVLTRTRDHFANGDRRAVMLIDEAHLIADWSAEDQASVRALLKDEHQRIGVLLVSSEHSAASVLLPVLKFLGEPFLLERIADEDWRHDLRERFALAGVPIATPALDRLLGLSTGQPYCTMLLARQCAELGQAFGAVNLDVVDLALPTVRAHEAWDLLRYT